LTFEVKTPFAAALLSFPRSLGDFAQRRAAINVGKILECALFYDTVFIDANRVKRTTETIETDGNDVVTNPEQTFLLPDHIEVAEYEGTEKKEILLYVNSLTDKDIVKSMKHNYSIEAHLYSNKTHPVVILSPIITRNVNYADDGLSRRWIEQSNKFLTEEGDMILIEQIRGILENKSRFSLLAQSIIAKFIPDINCSKDMYFYGERNDLNIVSIYTNLNLKQMSNSLNAANGYSYIYGPGNSVCFILDKMIEIVELNWKSSLSDLAIWTNNAYESCILSYYSDFINYGRRSDIELFQSTILHNVKPIVEAINSGRLKLASYRDLYDESRKFRAWARQTDERVLVQDYIDKLSDVHWLQRLPSKTARFTIATAIGFGLDLMGSGGIGTMAGIAAGAIDTFMLDKLYEGWRPSMFVTKLKAALD
jgi:hypothetical protein